jgi:hypothetical protein
MFDAFIVLRNQSNMVWRAVSLGMVFKFLFHMMWQVDALTTKRGKEGGWVVERLLNQV